MLSNPNNPYRYFRNHTILHVNNLSSVEIRKDNSEKAREKSRKVLLDHLKNCRNRADYHLPSQEELTGKITEIQAKMQRKELAKKMADELEKTLRDEEVEEIERREASSSSGVPQPQPYQFSPPSSSSGVRYGTDEEESIENSNQENNNTPKIIGVLIVVSIIIIGVLVMVSRKNKSKKKELK